MEQRAAKTSFFKNNDKQIRPVFS